MFVPPIRVHTTILQEQADPSAQTSPLCYPRIFSLYKAAQEDYRELLFYAKHQALYKTLAF